MGCCADVQGGKIPPARSLSIKKPLPRLLRPQKGNRVAVKFFCRGSINIHFFLLTGIHAG
jgi:hypothetical protein